MDEFLRQLAAGDPEFAAALEEQDKRLAQRDSIEAWRERLRKFREKSDAESARLQPEKQGAPLNSETQAMLRGIARCIAREVDAAKAELRAEIDVARVHALRAVELAQRPRRRKKKMTRAEMDAFVMSRPRAPK